MCRHIRQARKPYSYIDLKFVSSSFFIHVVGVLRRQGSSQSDSSGFADSDHVESSDSTSLNKVRAFTVYISSDVFLRHL